MPAENLDHIRLLGDQIAATINGVDTDNRGNLFQEVANGLDKRNQYHTASYFRYMAKRYGVNEGLENAGYDDGKRDL